MAVSTFLAMLAGTAVTAVLTVFTDLAAINQCFIVTSVSDSDLIESADRDPDREPGSRSRQAKIVPPNKREMNKFHV
jgi:hypothetical protein